MFFLCLYCCVIVLSTCKWINNINAKKKGFVEKKLDGINLGSDLESIFECKFATPYRLYKIWKLLFNMFYLKIGKEKNKSQFNDFPSCVTSFIINVLEEF